jgi:hypothetical protein
VNWKKSSESGTSGCVEVAFGADIVLVRDSKATDGPVLTFTVEAWRMFIADLKAECPTRTND